MLENQMLRKKNRYSPLKPRLRQAGLTLLEVLVSLSILSASTIGLVAISDRYAQDTVSSVAASQMRTFGEASRAYIKDNYAAVQTLAYREASAGRGALLTAAYCAGLGIPFVLTGLGMRHALGAFAVVKRHYDLVLKVGGGLLFLVGLMLVSGLWEDVMVGLRGWVSGFETVV